MKAAFFDANTFGLGELITQKKLFRVPEHQRSYSWTSEAVEAFLEDISNAFLSGSVDYFVGLVVIQGPIDGEWILLDGQQRLSTITMVYGAMRNWLSGAGLHDDAKQIEGEFLSVRRLGGDYSSRMILNQENQEFFDEYIVRQVPTRQIEAEVRARPRKSSNRIMLEAAVECQKWLSRVLAPLGTNVDAQSRQIFRLASFIESNIKVVSVEVSSDVDAYILFEALNDRGLELSAMDLIKNYTYSKVTPSNRQQIDDLWRKLSEYLEHSSRDDFLKVFWTSRNGLIQKTMLFRAIRQEYVNETSVLALLREMAEDALLLEAIDDAEHPLWSSKTEEIRDAVFSLNILGSKQVRPVLLAGLHRLSDPNLLALMKILISTVVRFQIVGRGRTGVMERIFGRLCAAIQEGEIVDETGFRFYIGNSEMHIDDQSFSEGFAQHSETKLSRYSYFLSAIELQLLGQQTANSVSKVFSETKLMRIASTDNTDVENTIGHYVLVGSVDMPNERTLLTRSIDIVPSVRSERLGEVASRVWPL